MKRNGIIAIVSILVLVVALVFLRFQNPLKKGETSQKSFGTNSTFSAMDPKGQSASPSKDASQRLAVLEAIKIDNFLQRTTRLRSIFSIWAETDPRAAAAMLVQLEPKYRDYEAVGSVARALASLDVQAALQFAEQVKDKRVGAFILQITLEVWGEKSPEEAGRYVLGKFPPQEQGSALSVFAGAWAKREPEGALAFAQQVQDSHAKDVVLATILNQIAEANPDKAIAAWALMPPGNRARDNLAGIISRNWSKTSPEKAAAWATSLPEEDPARVEALKQSIAAWSKSDPKAASEFMLELPSGLSRDEAVGVFVNGISSVDPATATEWAGTIERFPERRAAYMRIAKYYAGRSAEESKAWLNSLSGLPLSWQNELVGRINSEGSSLPIQ